jgi:hypothetical protein
MVNLCCFGGAREKTEGFLSSFKIADVVLGVKIKIFKTVELYFKKTNPSNSQ